ncbi:Fe2+/Zn2+ uptake regulation protein [Hoeflea sp. IMCC20628]|uniref:Fur family transcriptional regulator n=1 Tax=Hoeflea sp. IMCC20628 TaxID=1620421 RepID=UPI00063AFD3D|nr:Fur family transcriptional regulator [Hoeflea sp. IMCC20628]AKI01367.1 Fe2+/Zn2+ uptake regulation protein [Hoeflea sp. IMCC20628]
MNRDTHSHDHGRAPSDLTKNQSLVFGALSRAEGPLSAYTILDQLRDDGFRAPLQVYRALDKLVETGMVHRLESLNAFVACSHPGCDTHQTIAFAICETCGKVTEISDEALETRLRDLAREDGFTVKKAVVELRGLCAACR